MDRARRLGSVIVAEQDEHAAMARGAGIAAMPEGIAGTVHSGPLAVPQRKDAVVSAITAHLGLLTTPDRRQSEILVQAWLEPDALCFEPFAGAGQLQVVSRKRRAAITGHIAGSIEAGQAVAPAQNERQADECLDAGEENASLRQIVFVIE